MSTQLPKDISQRSGVYIFRNAKKAPIYIGKAANLKKRLAQYINLGKVRFCRPSAGSQGCITGLVSYWRRDVSAKIRMMLKEAARVEWIDTESEIDALIKEAEMIKAHIPKYNILMRDDKSYFYVGFTKEEFPRIFLTHQPGALKAKSYKLKANFIGPFTSGTALKLTLRMLRGIFPYCTCKEMHKRPCLNSEIGRCLGYCCLRLNQKHSNILQNVGMFSWQQREYRKNIQHIIAVLRGRRKSILRELQHEMGLTSKNQEFEKAAKLRDQIFGLENIQSHSILPNGEIIRRPLNWTKIQNNLAVIFGAKIERAEGYDISNISGTEAVGSMVVFERGRPNKSEYRKFKIKTVHQISDVDMLKEVIRRRLTHSEWKFPDLMLIDGGRPQLNAAISALRSVDSRIKIASLAKREEELYTENRNPIKISTLPADTAFFFQRIRDESHRFAKRYHHKRREIFYRLPR